MAGKGLESMFTVLVTGSMGAGKSSVIAHLKTQNYPTFQADIRAKKLLNSKSSCYPQLKKLFSEKDFFLKNGEFNRNKLAQTLFKHPKKRQAMEAIIHPLVQKAFKKFLKDKEKQGYRIVFYEVPLISKLLFDRFDKNILVTCSKDLTKKRLIKKGWAEKEIERRRAVQVSESEIFNKIDFLIKNEGSLKKLNKQVDKVVSLIKEEML